MPRSSCRRSRYGAVRRLGRVALRCVDWPGVGGRGKLWTVCWGGGHRKRTPPLFHWSLFRTRPLETKSKHCRGVSGGPRRRVGAGMCRNRGDEHAVCPTPLPKDPLALALAYWSPSHKLSSRLACLEPFVSVSHSHPPVQKLVLCLAATRVAQDRFKIETHDEPGKLDSSAFVVLCSLFPTWSRSLDLHRHGRCMQQLQVRTCTCCQVFRPKMLLSADGVLHGF